MPKVSIITGIYNCENTLDDAITSIQKQIFTDWEWILCDDGSTDRTYSIAVEKANTDHRLCVIKNASNMGLAATLNRCLQYAKGEYVARMDGDDVCPPERLAYEVDFLNSHPRYAVVSGWMECFDEKGTHGLIKYPEKPQYKDFIKRSCICHAACMIRNEALRKIGCYCTDKSVYRVEDYDLWVRLYDAGYEAYNLQKVLYCMRDDRDAIKRRKFKYRINESKVCYKVFKGCNLPIQYIYYPMRPLIKGLLPIPIYKFLHKKRLSTHLQK